MQWENEGVIFFFSCLYFAYYRTFDVEIEMYSQVNNRNQLHSFKLRLLFSFSLFRNYITLYITPHAGVPLLPKFRHAEEGGWGSGRERGQFQISF